MLPRRPPAAVGEVLPAGDRSSAVLQGNTHWTPACASAYKKQRFSDPDAHGEGSLSSHTAMGLPSLSGNALLVGVRPLGTLDTFRGKRKVPLTWGPGDTYPAAILFSWEKQDPGQAELREEKGP